MSKAILISVNPKWVVKILNGEKTIEVRKKFPKDYVGWVYIYCCKDIRNGLYWVDKWVCVNQKNCIPSFRNGKVVARFWCDKVDAYVNGRKWVGDAIGWGIENGYEHILPKCCLTDDEIWTYADDLSFYAIHISKLEIFDRPRELSGFYKVGFNKEIAQAVYIQNKSMRNNRIELIESEYKLTKAPQNWCYIEGDPRRCQIDISNLKT